MNSPIKIAVTGPESTGKSKLSGELAVYFQAGLVDEFARNYLENIQRDYTLSDFIYISQNQINNEILLGEKHSLLICDTDTTVLKIWCENAYQNLHPQIADYYENVKYDLYLLCDVDLPWEPDPLREHPDKRAYFFDWYKRELDSRQRLYEIIRGEGPVRFENALRAIKKHLPQLFKTHQ